ncbi:MAG: iron-containing alcohol dehydrogenase family protein, partial [Alphaproteobacteria bacterium]
IEENIVNNLIEILENKIGKLSNKKIVIFTSEKGHERFKHWIDSLLEKYEELSLIYIDDNSYDIAVELAKKITIEDYDIVIGLGGGRILDTSKYVSYISKKTYIAIPTTLSNDGLTSPIAVLKTHEGRSKSFGCKSPDGLIADINIFKNSPKNLVIAGIGDTVSNYTSLYDWKLESKHKNIPLNDFAYLLSDVASNLLLGSREEDISSPVFLKQLVESIVLSGLAMDIAGSSRPCSGSEHLFSHSLDEHYNLNLQHGIQVALGSIVSCIFQGRSYEPIISFLKRYKVDVYPMSYGITKEIFVGAWMKAKATRPERFSILDTFELTEEYLIEVYDKIEEITR